MANVLSEQGGKLDSEQKKITKSLIRIGKRKGRSNRDIITALITGLQESGLRNLPIGAESSGGWRQERSIYYPDPTNVKHSAERFYKELRSAPKGSVGEEAQATQRSAYPSAYQPHVKEAQKILKMLGGISKPKGANLPASKSSKGVSLQGPREAPQTAAQSPVSAPAFIKTQAGKVAALNFINSRKSVGDISEFLSQKQSYGASIAAATEVPSTKARKSEKALTGAPLHTPKEELKLNKKTPPGSSGSGLVNWAEKVIGTDEGSPRQSKWAAAAGISPSTAWCSAFVAYGLRKQGYPAPAEPAYSGTWLNWSGGKKVNYKNVKPGDILVYDWGDGGITDHVGIYVGHGQYIGGNNSDNSVGKSEVPVGNIVGVVRPTKRRHK